MILSVGRSIVILCLQKLSYEKNSDFIIEFTHGYFVQ